MTRPSKRKKRQSITNNTSNSSNDQVNMNTREKKKCPPKKDECDIVYDYRLDQIIHVKYATTPDRIQLWVELLKKEYSGNDSIIQDLHGGGEGGKQIKIITGVHAGTIIELFYDTGMIVVKGKSPQFKNWAHDVFPILKKKLPDMSDSSVVVCETVDSSKCENVESNKRENVESSKCENVESSKSENVESSKCEKVESADKCEKTVTCEKVKTDKCVECSPKSAKCDEKKASETLIVETPVNRKQEMRDFIKTALSCPIRRVTPIEKIQEDIEVIKSSMVNLEKAVAVIPELKEMISSDKSVLQEVNQELNKENKLLRLKQANEGQITEIKALKEKILSLGKENESLKSDKCNMLQEQNQSLKLAKDNHHQMEKDNSKLEKEVEKLEKVNEKLEKELEKSEKDTDKLQNEKEKLENAYARLRKEYDDLLKEDQSLRRQNEVCRSLQMECVNLKAICKERLNIMEQQAEMIKGFQETFKNRGNETQKNSIGSKNSFASVVKNGPKDETDLKKQTKSVKSSEGNPPSNEPEKREVYVKGENDKLSMFNEKKDGFKYNARFHKIPEIAYQMSKAESTLGRNSSISDRMYGSKSGKEVKEKAKQLPFNRHWQREKRGEIKKIMRSVLQQDDDTKRALKDTGSKYILHNVADPYWGTGEDNNGQNTYGIILMELRKELFQIEFEIRGRRNRYYQRPPWFRNYNNYHNYNRYPGQRPSRKPYNMWY